MNRKGSPKPQYFVHLILFTVLFLLLGCSDPIQSSGVASLTINSTLLPTAPVRTPQPTDTPRSTQATTPTPTHTPTPVPTSTPTPFPTLEPKEKQAFIQEMLESNSGCELPCWWSITPGETNWEEMRAFFVTQGIGLSVDGHLDLDHLDPEGKYHINMMDVKFQRENDLVQGVNIRNDHYYTPFQDSFTNIWQRYSMQQVFARYGPPSQINLILTTGQPCGGTPFTPFYDMWITYDSLGIAIRYSGDLIPDNEGWFVCPVFGQWKSIEIQLQSPAANTPLAEIDLQGLPDGLFVAGALSDLTGMSVQEFYKTFSQPNPQTCPLVIDPSPWYDKIILPSESPTLSHEAEDTLLVELLAGNDDCQLPCWGGITPGVTRWQDAQQTFLSYGKSLALFKNIVGREDVYHVSIFGRHDPYPFDYVMKHMLDEQDDTVQLIGILGHTLGWFPPQHFGQDWQQYFLDRVLVRLGPPSQVLLHYWPYENAYYSVGVLYEDRGILIEYMGLVQSKSEEHTYSLEHAVICPTRDQITDINIWLKTPGAEPSLAKVFARLGGGYAGVPYFRSTPSLEEATGMNVGIFYEIYQDPNTQACLEVPAELGDYYP